MIKRAEVRCQNMDKEGVPLSSGIDIIDEETASDETLSVQKMPSSRYYETTRVKTYSL